jgi:hypothetical protein
MNDGGFGYTRDQTQFVAGLILTVYAAATQSDYYGFYMAEASASAHCGGDSNSTYSDIWNFGSGAYAQAMMFP